MARTFNCPSCGGSLSDIHPGEVLIHCPFCSSSVIVPPELRGFAPEDPARRAAASPAIQEIGDLLSRGQKIEAIRLYREVFDTGLKEAKDAVETLEAGGRLPIAQSYSPGPPPVDSNAVMDEIRALLSQGNKIEAIKRFRESYPVGLREAKEAVEAIDLGSWNPAAAPPATRAISFSGFGLEADQADQLTRFAELVAEGNRVEAVKYYRRAFDTSSTQAVEAVEKVMSGQSDVVARWVKHPSSYRSLAPGLSTRPVEEAESTRMTTRRVALILGIALALLFLGALLAVIMMVGS